MQLYRAFGKEELGRINNNLKVVNPSLAREWHSTKNGNLTPKDVTYGSNKKVWWRCKKGHVWRTMINARNNGNGCPYCSGKIADKDNCLQTINPVLAREWHPTRNKKLTPRKVTAFSHKRVWWLCKKGHEWEAKVSNRSSGNGCPYCSGHMICKDNCLKTIRPDLAREWHSSLNGKLTSKDITPSSHKKVWWRCKNGHAWQIGVYHRNRGNGCPYCDGKMVCEENSLQVINPILAREWHLTKNGKLTPRDVTVSSNKRVWWLCKKGHIWEAPVSNRNSGRGCPYCSGQRVCEDNCLQNVRPDLAEEWHSTLNGSLTPEDVTRGSGKRVWWLCNKNHEWQTMINHRNRGTGCPYCWKELQKGLTKH